MLYSSITGAIGAVPADQAKEAKTALRRSSRIPTPQGGVLKDLVDGGFLIPEGTDEEALRKSIYLGKYNRHSLQLIILPTEECNFRCVYCYESFERGTMKHELVEAIKSFVEAEHNKNELKEFSLSWFGGEPLLASEVVVELTQFFYEFCISRKIQFTCGITTNGSLLTPELVESLVPYGLGFFQITLDGIGEEHDKKRVAIDNKPSFERIITNLRYLKSTSYIYVVSLRHNYDPNGLQSLEQFIEFLQSEFGGDPRFTTAFEAIGTWGGANDDALSVCDGKSAAHSRMRAKRLAIEAGFHNTFQVESFQPNGYICYAANPRSLVVGADGRLYKCTVELDYHDRNVVGQLHSDGSADIDWRKMALWTETNGNAFDGKCSTCFFSPSCHGAICPKQWMEQAECECPPEKHAMSESLQLLRLESELPASISLASIAQCTK
ncbi:MAG: hypothetical protein RLZZ156_973 [Deinococcota bacterium]